MKPTLSNNDTFRINGPDVVYEVMGEEVVILDLKSGCYYSVNDIGAKLLVELVEVKSLERLLESSQEVFECDSDQRLTEEIKAFVEQLVAEGIIIAETLEGIAAKEIGHQSPKSEAKIKFLTPKIDKYTDLEDLLLLDPIHDVGQEGWPQKD